MGPATVWHILHDSIVRHLLLPPQNLKEYFTLCIAEPLENPILLLTSQTSSVRFFVAEGRGRAGRAVKKMWGFGGRYYWGRRESEKVEGIVVVFAWMSSQEKHLKNYVNLYSSLGWNSLVCHSEFLNLFFPEKATALAFEILNELIKELKVRPCPVVLASFSGGPKACMYKVLQIIDGRNQSHPNWDEYKLVKDCVCGHIYDSTPVDFKSDLGTRFILHPTVLQMSQPPLIVKWIANSISYSLDTLFLTRFESQRADYWQTLYSSVSMGAPYLIFCSEDDDLAPCNIICNFAQRLEDLGGNVKMVKWNKSSHVGHYRNYPVEYSAAVTEFLGKSSTIYSQRIRQLKGEEGMGLLDSSHDDEVRGPFHSLKKATKNANQIVRRVALGSNHDHFVVPTSVEYHDGKAVGSVENDGHREGFIQLTKLPRINAHGVLGQILYDVCIPQNVEDWDVRASSSFNSHFNSIKYRNPIKCIRRSRL